MIGGDLASITDWATFGAVHDSLLISSIAFDLADFLVLAGVVGVGVHLVGSSRDLSRHPELDLHRPVHVTDLVATPADNRRAPWR